MLFSPPLDAGIPLMALLYGSVIWAIVALIVTTILEALLMRVYLKSLWRKSLWYSFIMNLASLVVGIVEGALLILASPRDIIQHPFPIIVAYLLTVVIEFFCLKSIFKPAQTNSAIIRFVVFANLVSYLCLFILSWVLY